MVFLVGFTVILEKTIRIPRSLSVKAAGVLKGFLNKVNVFFNAELLYDEKLLLLFRILVSG